MQLTAGRLRSRLVMGLTVVSVVVVLGIMSYHPSASTPVFAPGVPPLPVRCPETVSLSEAQSMAGGTFALPDTKLASQENLAWLASCPDPTVVAQFGSGIWLVFEPWEISLSPSDSFSQRMKDNPGLFITTLDGISALEEDALKDSTHTTDGGVEFVIKREDVQVYGDGNIPLSDLEDVARSIAGGIRDESSGPSPDAG
jgi:hypothetical protein